MDHDARRVTPHRRQHWGVGPDPAMDGLLDETLVRAPDTTARRQLLWRDSATILIGVILALLVLRSLTPVPVAVNPTDTPYPSAFSIRVTPPPLSLGPDGSFGPIVDESLGIDATPTPVPVVTLGPTPTTGADPTATPSPSPPPPLTAAFTWRQVPGTRSVKFTDTSTGTVVSRTWLFGDGGSATGPTPSHTYASSGSYTVRLTVTFDTGTTSSTTTVVKVLPPAPTPTPPGPTPTPPPPTPTPTPTPPPPSVTVSCALTPTPQEVVCNATVSNIVSASQSWTFSPFGTPFGGDGSNSITILYVDVGPKTITITVTGLDGSTISASDTVVL